MATDCWVCTLVKKKIQHFEVVALDGCREGSVARDIALVNIDMVLEKDRKAVDLVLLNALLDNALRVVRVGTSFENLSQKMGSVVRHTLEGREVKCSQVWVCSGCE